MNSESSNSDSVSGDAAADLSAEALRARIRALETELAGLRKQGYRDHLGTVKVPAPFEAPFLAAQQYVAEYFAERVEQPETATIAIAGERYVLLRAASLSVEFIELVMSLYSDKRPEDARGVANNLLFDLAHAIGRADARSFQQKMGVKSPIENLSAGPIHFAFAGWAFVDISAESNPSPDENFFLKYDHPYSFESHSWLNKGKRSEVPVCVMSAGYSSGWCEESFGVPLVAVEIECVAAGGEQCRFIMAPPSRIEDYLKQHQHRHSSSTGGTGEIPEFFQRKRLEDELRESHETLEQRVSDRTYELEAALEELRLLHSAVENASEGFMIMEDIGGETPLRIKSVNRGYTRITGLAAEDVVGKSIPTVPVSAEAQSIIDEMHEHVRRHEPFQAEFDTTRANGGHFTLEFHLMPVQNDRARITNWICVLRDVSDRKAHLDALKHQALHDDLTGLPNRVLLHDRIEQGVLVAHRKKENFALLFIDLDGFKEINDTFGHYTGDILLSKVGSRLRGELRSMDTIARLGGDEFAVLLGGVDTEADAMRMAKKLLAVLKRPFTIEGQNLVIGASIGIVCCPAHGTDAVTLMRRADIAMYAAKEAKSGALVYTIEQDVHSPARIRMVNELHNSIDDQHLELYYQPQVRIADGRVSKVEALLRWNHPSGNQLLPDEFVPLAEGSDLIDRISFWVLKTAIRDCSAWQGAGHAVGVSVNLSPRNLRIEQLPDMIAGLLQEHRLAPEFLTLEITESGILSEAVLSAGVLDRLQAIGIGISIDDFGTGYSSLLHLKRMPFDELKIDYAFTRDILSNPHDAAIVRSTIELGHQLGRKIVAEGVEDRAALELLREYGCDFAQGYYFSAAIPEAALREWLVARSGRF